MHKYLTVFPVFSTQMPRSLQSQFVLLILDGSMPTELPPVQGLNDDISPVNTINIDQAHQVLI